MAQVQPARDRIRELRQKKRASLNRRAVIVFFLVCVIVTSIIFITRSSYLQIEQIVIRGNNIVREEEVKSSINDILKKNYLYIIPRTNLFLYPKNEIEFLIKKQFPRFETVHISRVNFSTVVLDVRERQSLYTWCDGLPLITAPNEPACYYVDENGFIFSHAPYFTGGVYFKFFGSYGWEENQAPIGARILDEDTFKKIIRFKEGLESEGLVLYGFTTYPTGVYSFLLSPVSDDTKQKIVFTVENDIDAVYANLVSALNAPPLKTDLVKKFDTFQYIDLRYDNKVYYRFQSEDIK